MGKQWTGLAFVLGLVLQLVWPNDVENAEEMLLWYKWSGLGLSWELDDLDTFWSWCAT